MGIAFSKRLLFVFFPVIPSKYHKGFGYKTYTHTHTHKNRLKTNKQKQMWPGTCLQSQFCQKTKPWFFCQKQILQPNLEFKWSAKFCGCFSFKFLALFLSIFLSLSLSLTHTRTTDTKQQQPNWRKTIMRQKQPQLPEKNKTKPVEDQGGFFLH